MKRLCIDARMIRSSGIGRYIRGLLPALIQTGYWNITLLGNPEELKEYKSVQIIPAYSGIYMPQEQLELWKKIPGTDLFWTPHYNVPLFLFKKCKRIVTIHDVFHLTEYCEMSDLKKAYANFLLSYAVKKSERIITVSEFSKNEMINKMKLNKKTAEKITVIPNSIDPLFNPSNNRADKKNFLQSKGILSGFILYVGNVKPHKNLIGLVQAFSILKNQFPDIKLAIIGKKENFISGESGLNTLILEKHLEKSVHFTGAIDDIELLKWYQFAECLVFPTFYEGFGFPPLEAMACGIPAVVSDIPPVREVCGESACFVDPKLPESIADGITKVLKDTEYRDKLVKEGFKRVKKYTPEKTIQAHLDCLQELTQLKR